MRDLRPRDSIQHLVGTLFRRVARVGSRAVKRFEVSGVQANILVALWAEGPMTIGALQELLALGSSTLTGAVDRMEKAGLVFRRDVPGDRRAWLLEPADWPAKKRAALFETVTRLEQESFSGLTAAERAELLRLLAKANASIARLDAGEDEP